jgi:hypothetical protein
MSLNVTGAGKSIQEPLVATTYCPGLPDGSGVRPTLLASCNSGGLQLLGNAVAVINLRFYNPIRDPSSGTYDNTCTGTGNGSGFSLGNSFSLNSLLIEGSTFEFFNSNGMAAAASGNTAQNIYLRRNLIANSWSGNGMFFGGNTGAFVLEENTICNNGWNANVTSPLNSASYNSSTGAVTLSVSRATGYITGSTGVVVSGITGTGSNLVNGTFTLTSGTFDPTLVYNVGTGQTISGLSGGIVQGVADGPLAHNWYMVQAPDYPTIPLPFPNATTFSPPISADMIYTGNISCNGIGADQFRSGGVAQYNSWIADPGGISVQGNQATVTDNLFTEMSNYYVSGAAAGTAVTISTGTAPSFTQPATLPQTVSNNILTNNNGTQNAGAIILQGPACNPSNWDCALPATGWTTTNNAICNYASPSIVEQSKGGILSLNNLVGGTGGTPGIYPGTNLTGGSGTTAQAVVTVGAGGAVTDVEITQFGKVGALFTASVTGTTLTVTNIEQGGIILPNTTTFTSILEQAKTVTLGRTIVAQLTNDPISGLPNGNGTYQLSASLSFSGAGQTVVFITANNAPGPQAGINYVSNDTLGITAGSGASQIPGLSGFSIQVGQVASNTTTPNTIQTANCNGLGPNSTITVGSYNASLANCPAYAGGCTATAQAFITSALAKSKSDAFGNSNWPYALSSYAIVNAFKSAFGQTPNAPVYSP